MKLEIYQVGKVPPLTVVECDRWEMNGYCNPVTLELYKEFKNDIGERDEKVIATFFANNIAGFKEVGEDK
jgi:hypothetical protein